LVLMLSGYRWPCIRYDCHRLLVHQAKGLENLPTWRQRTMFPGKITG
jgi:hypothetical protein